MNKKMFLVLFLGLLLMPLGVFAQEVELTSENKFKVVSIDDSSIDFLVSYDNNDKVDGHLILNDGIITKYGLDNKIKWQKKGVEPENLKVENISSDNSYGLTVKGDNDVYIYQTDSAGNVLWKIQWGGNHREEIYNVFTLYDDNGNINGYLFVCLTTSTDITGIDPGFVLFKLDLNGKLVWQYNYLYAYGEGASIFSVDNIMHLFDIDNSNNQLMHSYTDLNNDMSNECSYDMSGYNTSRIVPSKDKNGKIDGAILVGMKNNVRREVFPVSWNTKKLTIEATGPAFIMKVDFNCNKVWENEYGVDNSTTYISAISSKQVDESYDGYITVGRSNSSDLIGDSDVESVSVINKYDLDGNLISQQKYSVNNFTYNSYFNISENYDINGNFNGFIVDGNSEVCPVENTSSGDENAKYSVKKLDYIPCTNYVVVNKYTYKNYNVKKEETDKGTVEVNTSNAYPGDIIKIKVTPKTGYMVSKIIVKDSLGREIEVDGDSFVMPEGDVTVSVIYARVTNPVTSAVLDIIIFISIIVGLSTILINGKKQEVK